MEEKKIQVDIKVPNQTRYLSLIGKIGEDIANELYRYSGDRETLAYHINLVLTEAMANAIRHANASDPDKVVRVVIFFAADELVIQVHDSGQGFDINNIPTPNSENVLEDRGRGISLIRSLMDSVCYRSMADGNVLEMTKKLL
ncbi:ATP-binding protein [Geobacter pelophilus]|jgi:serine/threonine-protein kinase RsbW|uniref:ATP-binding protein n=1 Tax=Geoanaerobacter pelophilus TaxID=60036 RepID=A0AAW4KVR1_9BACT|nr:ATP-binding protein [Geoanaerobacter pelophilus]MBT0662749.1 ATP-binding protein [Geoanaerobacter pelophilus]